MTFNITFFVGMSLRGGSGCAQAPRRKSSTSCLRLYSRSWRVRNFACHWHAFLHCIIPDVHWFSKSPLHRTAPGKRAFLSSKMIRQKKTRHVLGCCKGCYAHLHQILWSLVIKILMSFSSSGFLFAEHIPIEDIGCFITVRCPFPWFLYPFIRFHTYETPLNCTMLAVESQPQPAIRSQGSSLLLPFSLARRRVSKLLAVEF